MLEQEKMASAHWAYHALCATRRYILQCRQFAHWQSYEDRLLEQAHGAILSALEVPPRNCDVYTRMEDAWRDFKRSHDGANFDADGLEAFAKWLFLSAAPIVLKPIE